MRRSYRAGRSRHNVGVPDDFLIARNPDGDSTLPYLLRVPLGPDGVLLKARDTWPRTTKIYCHRVDAWPEDAEIVDRVGVRTCERRGAAIDLVLDRGRENRSQLVMTTVRGGRQVIFWQTARTARQARPGVSAPAARASGIADLPVVVDSRERYGYTFADRQVAVSRRRLDAGDYAVEHEGTVVAAVERKSLDDLTSSLTSGRLRFQLGELSGLPHAAVVVEERYSRLLALQHVRPATILDALAECQVRWPSVPVIFCETRKLAQEWTYRFLAAALADVRDQAFGDEVVDALAPGSVLPPRAPSAAEIRVWARAHGHDVSDRGRVPATVVAAFEAARGSG